MAIKDILVHVDDHEANAVRTAFAARLAVAHDAHLTGLYVMPPVYIPPYVAAEVGAQVFEAQERVTLEGMEKAKAAFHDAAKSAGVPSVEWRGEDGYADEIVTMHARYADLLVVGQRDPNVDAAAGATEIVEQAVLHSGRPVLVVPYAGRFDKLPERVLVAWNAGPQAARAVNDALPLMAQAKTVQVMAINPEQGPDGHGDVPGADISRHLARHGVTAEASHVQASDMEVGDMLLSRASDFSADLIVMGGYGQSRLRELVMGGASRTILRHMTAPVLMAH